MNYEVVVQQYLYFLLWSFLIHCRLVSCSCGWCSALSLTWSWSLCCFRWYFILASLCVSFCPCIKMLLITDWSSRCDAVFRWFYDAPKFFVLSTEAVSVAIYQVFTHLLIRIFYEFADDFYVAAVLILTDFSICSNLPANTSMGSIGETVHVWLLQWLRLSLWLSVELSWKAVFIKDFLHLFWQTFQHWFSFVYNIVYTIGHNFLNGGSFSSETAEVHCNYQCVLISLVSFYANNYSWFP